MKNLVFILLFLPSLSFSQTELLRFNAIRLCDSVQVIENKARPNLHSYKKYKDSFELKVRLYENCGLYSKQGAFVLQNDTLNLLWTENNLKIEKEGVIYENGTWFHTDSMVIVSSTACDCYMELIYVLKGIKKLPPLKVKNRRVYSKDSIYRIYTPTYKIHEGDTINFTNKYGIELGKWMKWDDKNRVIEIENKLGSHFSDEYESFTYHDNNQIKIHQLVRYKKNGFMMEEEYDEKGVLRKRYFNSDLNLENDDDYFQITYEEFFDEKGELMKREIKDVRNNLFEKGFLYE